MSAFLVALASTLVLLQDPPAEPAPQPEAPAPGRPAPVLDFAKPFDHAGYEAALGAIAEAFPDLMRVRSLGKSRGGRDLWLAVVADTAEGEPRRNPAAVVLTDLDPGGGDAVAGPEAALFVLEDLLRRARADPEIRARFRRSALYVLPAPDPDRAFPATESSSVGDAARRTCRLEENFPARWQPFGDDVRAPGPYALSEPESLTLARFLLDRENVSTLVVLSRAEARGATPGSLRAYAREILGLEVRDSRPWTGEARPTEIGSAPQGFVAAAEACTSVLDGLPRLECGPSSLERLRPDLWLLDLPLENRGTLPTLGAESRRPGFPSVSMKVEGGRLVACALRGATSEGFRPVDLGVAIVPIGHLDGLEALGVRIVVQAEEGAQLAISFRSARAGTAGLDAPLQ